MPKFKDALPSCLSPGQADCIGPVLRRKRLLDAKYIFLRAKLLPAEPKGYIKDSAAETIK